MIDLPSLEVSSGETRSIELDWSIIFCYISRSFICSIEAVMKKIGTLLSILEALEALEALEVMEDLSKDDGRHEETGK